MATSKIVFQKSLKELRIILCSKSKSSQGVRDFVEKHYVPLKKANPDVPILIRECNNVEPKIYARYAFGKEVSAAVANVNSESILNQIIKFSGKAEK